MTESDFSSIGDRAGDIDVRLSYRIIELFSKGLYRSPNKAVEELVVNSFDAGARQVQVLLSSDLSAQGATIAVVDDGEGMGADDLKRHWLIGVSNKRNFSKPPHGRQQIGKFGIGKLATYVLADRLTHISKHDGCYYSASMDYDTIDQENGKEIGPEVKPIQVPLRKLSPAEAEQAVRPWTETREFKAAGMPLFGKGSPPSWTFSIMSSLKDKANEIKRGHLRWVLQTALPLRDDFSISLDGEKLGPSRAGKGRLLHWKLGEDLTELPGNEDITVVKEPAGIHTPELGNITGYVEAYEDLLTTGKSEGIGRSHGFFVYVRGRLISVNDGHFGISPNELRHGTFDRFRLVIHIDKLDEGLRSSREMIEEGPLLENTQNLLRSIFKAARSKIEEHDRGEKPGAKLSRRVAASPARLSRKPIVSLCRAVMEDKTQARHLIVPEYKSAQEQEKFLHSLEQKAEKAKDFVTGVKFDSSREPRDGWVRFDTESGILMLNELHPFVSVFHDEFANKKMALPLELMAMAEVLSEARLYALGVTRPKINEFLSQRDQLLRSLADESGWQSPQSVANALSDARNDPTQLEQCVNDAFNSLGFEVMARGRRGEPDGVAFAYLSATESGESRHYKVSLEAKSKRKSGAKVSAQDIGISGIVRQRDKFECDHAIVVGPAFQTSQGEGSALGKEIQQEREKSEALGQSRTITLINIDDLAELVRLRYPKRVGLLELRKLFQMCSLPEESSEWIENIRKKKVKKSPFREIVETLSLLQQRDKRQRVNYSTLRNELMHRKKPIEFEVDEDLAERCRAMAQMAPEEIIADETGVELDQSVENVMNALEKAMHDYPPDE